MNTIKSALVPAVIGFVIVILGIVFTALALQNGELIDSIANDIGLFMFEHPALSSVFCFGSVSIAVLWWYGVFKKRV